MSIPCFLLRNDMTSSSWWGSYVVRYVQFLLVPFLRARRFGSPKSWAFQPSELGCLVEFGPRHAQAVKFWRLLAKGRENTREKSARSLFGCLQFSLGVILGLSSRHVFFRGMLQNLPHSATVLGGSDCVAP